MSESNCTEWKSTVYVAALDIENAAVLLQRQEDGRHILPQFTVEGGRWETTTAKMQEQMESTLGIKAQALYRAVYREEIDICQAEVIIIVEADAPHILSGSWVSRKVLADVALSNPAHCTLLDEALNELETGERPALRPPWAKPGWQREAAEWMTAELTRAGWTPTGPTEIGRSWALSYVMRIPAVRGDSDQSEYIYFKTSLDLPLFVNEAVVTDGLAALYPDHAPLPVAVNAEKNWMMLSDFGELVGHNAPLEDRLKIIEQYGALQVKSAEQVEELLALGCIDRRLDWMVGEIEPFLTHPEIGKAITAEEAAQLLSMIAPLQKMCRKLNDYGVPDALIHGDLHGSNVARNHSTSDKLLFFDWTDSAISHPFFDMLVIYTEKDTAKRQTMRDAYLQCWQKYESQERLLELWRMAEALAAVYHGISYLYIFLGVEEWGKIDFYGAMPYWLRKILNYGDFVNEYQ
jgi:hypothetical protein